MSPQPLIRLKFPSDCLQIASSHSFLPIPPREPATPGPIPPQLALNSYLVTRFLWFWLRECAKEATGVSATADGSHALVCVRECVRGLTKPLSQVLSLKCIIIPLCQEWRQIVSPPAIAVSFLFSRSYTPRLHLSSGLWRDSGCGEISCFFIFPPGHIKNIRWRRMRTVIADSINCHSLVIFMLRDNK